MSAALQRLVAAMAFVASTIVALFATLYVVSSLLRIVTPRDVGLPDRLGQIAGGLFATAVVSAIGYGFAAALYCLGRAIMAPQAHSQLGPQQPLHDATQGVEVTGDSENERA